MVLFFHRSERDIEFTVYKKNLADFFRRWQICALGQVKWIIGGYLLDNVGNEAHSECYIWVRILESLKPRKTFSVKFLI